MEFVLHEDRRGGCGFDASAHPGRADALRLGGPPRRGVLSTTVRRPGHRAGVLVAPERPGFGRVGRRGDGAVVPFA
ncbi:hypothetical protein ASD51_30950 [Streptomyces sp. Root55]|nr:hypothetical protein ASD51_30950 [Streptomyces sp. Root55]